jgi:hypothetical protein
VPTKPVDLASQGEIVILLSCLRGSACRRRFSVHYRVTEIFRVQRSHQVPLPPSAAVEALSIAWGAQQRFRELIEISLVVGGLYQVVSTASRARHYHVFLRPAERSTTTNQIAELPVGLVLVRYWRQRCQKVHVTGLCGGTHVCWVTHKLAGLALPLQPIHLVELRIGDLLRFRLRRGFKAGADACCDADVIILMRQAYNAVRL